MGKSQNASPAATPAAPTAQGANVSNGLSGAGGAATSPVAQQSTQSAGLQAQKFASQALPAANGAPPSRAPSAKESPSDLLSGGPPIVVRTDPYDQFNVQFMQAILD